MQSKELYNERKPLQMGGQRNEEKNIETMEHHLVLKTWNLFMNIGSLARPKEVLSPNLALFYNSLSTISINLTVGP